MFKRNSSELDLEHYCCVVKGRKLVMYGCFVSSVLFLQNSVWIITTLRRNLVSHGEGLRNSY